MKIETISISKIKLNPNNPRLIKDDKFTKLVQSIKDFPEMLNIGLQLGVVSVGLWEWNCAKVLLWVVALRWH